MGLLAQPKVMKTPASPLSDRECLRIQKSESGMAHGALLLLNSGSWILNSSARWGVFNGVGAF
jgi:hypothetical protein